jgi:hypothetical protein
MERAMLRRCACGAIAGGALAIFSIAACRGQTRGNDPVVPVMQLAPPPAASAPPQSTTTRAMIDCAGTACDPESEACCGWRVAGGDALMAMSLDPWASPRAPEAGACIPRDVPAPALGWPSYRQQRSRCEAAIDAHADAQRDAGDARIAASVVMCRDSSQCGPKQACCRSGWDPLEDLASAHSSMRSAPKPVIYDDLCVDLPDDHHSPCACRGSRTKDFVVRRAKSARGSDTHVWARAIVLLVSSACSRPTGSGASAALSSST